MKQSVTMDPRYSAQDVVRCTLCKGSIVPMHCDICHVNLCKDCVETHISDVTKDHKVVPLKHRGFTPAYPKCPKHSLKQCELHCKQCRNPICAFCISSKEHKGHKLVDILEIFKSKKESLKRDLKELEKSIFPKYRELASNIPVQKASLSKHSQELAKALDKKGDDLHREIDIIIQKLKSDINEMESKHTIVLDDEEDKISQTISEIEQTIINVHKLLDSNDVNFVFSYKSNNAVFRKLPSRLKVNLPSFSPHQINREQIAQQIGSLSALSFTKEERVYTEKTTEGTSSSSFKPLMDKPSIITTINSKHSSLYNVACLGDDNIWTSGDDNIMNLFNIQGELQKSIKNNSNNRPFDIALTKSEDLVYTDYTGRLVNKVKNTQIEKLMRLPGRRPRGLCVTSADDLLVVVVSDNGEATKVVRYSGSTEQQIIQFNDKGDPLYSYDNSKYVIENRNLDICVADFDAGAVVVVNHAGKFRFSYTGPSDSTKDIFKPRGITTDSQGRILAADYNNDRIHILDQDGVFLRFIESNSLHTPWGLCVDTKDNLFVAEISTGTIKMIKYSN